MHWPRLDNRSQWAKSGDHEPRCTTSQRQLELQVWDGWHGAFVTKVVTGRLLTRDSLLLRWRRYATIPNLTELALAISED